MTTTMNNVGRATRPEAVQGNDYIHPTLTGARGLLQDEPLIFELGGWDKTGVDLPAAELDASDLGDLIRQEHHSIAICKALGKTSLEFMSGHWNREVVSYKPCHHAIKYDSRIALSNKLKIASLDLNGWQIAQVRSHEIPY